MIPLNIVTANLKKELGSFFSTEAHRENDLIRYINAAVNDIIIARNFSFNKYIETIDVVEGQTQYNIPYQIETFYIKNNSGKDIDFMSFEDYFREDDKINKMAIYGDKMICETPGTYTIYYRGFPDPITSLSGDLDIPNLLFDMLVVRALYYGFMDIRAYDKAGIKDSIFQGMVKNTATRESDPRPLDRKRVGAGKSQTW